MQEVLDEDMPDLPEYKAPEDTDISIELQIPTVGAEVSVLIVSVMIDNLYHKLAFSN